jgi:hypothetical protein
MSIKYFVEQDTRSHLLRLDRPENICGLRQLCHDVEDKVFSLCESLTYIYASDLFVAAPKVKFEDSIFDESGNQYKISRTKKYDDNRIELDIMPAKECTGRMVERDVAISAEGMFKHIRVNVHESLKPAKIQIFEDFYRAIIEYSYNWFRSENLLQHIESRDNIAKSVSRNMYDQVRSLFSDVDLQRNIQLVIMGPKYGFRLLDQTLTNGIYGALKATPLAGYSANEMISVVACGLMPTQDCLMWETVKTGVPSDGKIKNAIYSKTRDVYPATLRFMYPNDEFRMYPFYVDSQRISVIAAYPVDLCKDIEPQLNCIKETELEHHIKGKAAQLHKLYEMSTAQSMSESRSKGDKAVKNQNSGQLTGVRGNIKCRKFSQKNYFIAYDIEYSKIMKEIEHLKKHLRNEEPCNENDIMIGQLAQLNCELSEKNDINILTIAKSLGKKVYDIAERAGCSLLAKLIISQLPIGS